MPNNLTNHKSLNQLISTASIIDDPTVVQFDPEGQLFKLPLSPPASAVSLLSSVTPSNPVVFPPYIHSIHRYFTDQTETLPEELDL